MAKWITHRVKSNVPVKVEMTYVDYAKTTFQDGKDKLCLKGRVNGEENHRIYVPLFLEEWLGENGYINRVKDQNGDDVPTDYAPASFEVLDPGPVEVLKAETDDGSIRWQVGALDGQQRPHKERASSSSASTAREAAPEPQPAAPRQHVPMSAVVQEFMTCYDAAMEIHTAGELDFTADSVYKLAFTIHQERKRLGIAYPQIEE